VKQTAPIISTDPGAALSEPLDELAPELELRHIVVAPGLHAARLDKALAEALPEFSRSYLQQLLEQGLLKVNGTPVSKAAYRVKAGDALALELRPTPQSQAFRAEPVAFAVVFEDAHLMVIDKPAGLVVHPAPGNWSGTLLNGLLAHHSDYAQVPRAGIVHRLDKDTSGLMVVARQRSVMDALVQAIAARAVSRQYLAVAQGRWTGAQQRSVDLAIGRDPRNRLRMAAVDLEQHAGKPARTDFVLLAQGTDCCLVRAILHTGRTHQIRVHMASLGHPLLADALYGARACADLERQALHATRLAFTHPVTQQALVFDSPLPPDLHSALRLRGLRYNAPTPAT